MCRLALQISTDMILHMCRLALQTQTDLILHMCRLALQIPTDMILHMCRLALQISVDLILQIRRAGSTDISRPDPADVHSWLYKYQQTWFCICVDWLYKYQQTWFCIYVDWLYKCQQIRFCRCAELALQISADLILQLCRAGSTMWADLSRTACTYDQCWLYVSHAVVYISIDLSIDTAVWNIGLLDRMSSYRGWGTSCKDFVFISCVF
jgi:hypothetical protein